MEDEFEIPHWIARVNANELYGKTPGTLLFVGYAVMEANGKQWIRGDFIWNNAGWPTPDIYPLMEFNPAMIDEVRIRKNRIGANWNE